MSHSHDPKYHFHALYVYDDPRIGIQDGKDFFCATMCHDFKAVSVEIL